MGHKILSISVSEEDFAYLKEDGYLKPSHIFRMALKNIRENRRQDIDTIKLLQNKNKILQEKLFEAQGKINES